MPALTGVRFFAVFHIFLFHLFVWYWESRNDDMPLLTGLANAPQWLVKFAVNGWVSTSFFFLLSGFILAYLYWGEDGELATTRRRFWMTRAARIYPIHLIVLAVTIPVVLPYRLSQGVGLGELIPSAIATVTLVQAWVPDWLPHISWPTWTISVLVFLYAIMPWLMKSLARLSRRRLIFLLALMPLISMLPTIIYHLRMVSGAELSMKVDMVVANNPLLWVPYFAAGMLLTRIFGLSRFKPLQSKPSRFAWGDLAVVAVIAIAVSGFIEQPWKFYLRQGLLMPFYMIIVIDLARGRGFFAKLFSLPGTGFMGETGFSIFIWQNVIVLVLYGSLRVAPDIAPYQHWMAIGLLLVLATVSTYLIEKPIASFIRRKYINR